MASVSAIRTAIKATIAAAIPTGIFGYDTVSAVTQVPAFVVIPRATNFAVAMGRGVDEHDVDVVVLVSKRDMALAQAELDKYATGAGSDSIRAAIFNARTLGLSNTDAHVTGMSGYGQVIEVGSTDYMSATLSLKVYSSGVS